MSSFTDTFTTISDSIRKMLGGSKAPDDRRGAFKEAFGFFPPDFETKGAERETFIRNSVQPILEQRAAVIQQMETYSDAGTQPADTETSRHEKELAFDRAYKVASDLKLAATGKTWRDFVPTGDRS